MVLVPALWACGEGEASDETGFQVAVAERRDLRLTVEATGLMEPIRTVEVKSKASGEILRLHVDVGDRVEPGALLAEVDPRDVRNAYEQAQADLEVAQARREISEAQLRRSTELLEAGVITEQEHEGMNLEFANARAALTRAETNLELAELKRSDVTIRAPLPGVILQKSVEEGQVIQSASGNVSGGTTLFIMANLDDMQVRTLVDETDMGQLRAGMAATVQVEAFPERVFEGEVEKIEPQATVQQNVTMFPVIVHLDNRSGFLKPGMNAEVEILIDERRGVVTVPNGALVDLREVGPASMVLGLDPESVQLDRSAFATLQPGSPGAGGPGIGAGTAGGSDEAGARQNPGGSEDFRVRRDSLMARVGRGEISQDSMRTIMAGFRNRPRSGGAGSGQAPNAASRPQAMGAPGGGAQRARPGASDSTENGRASVAFVVSEDGTIEARALLMGISDWDNTEVTAGLEEGERVALIGAAQLQAQSQEFLDRMRGRRMGPF